MNLMIWSSTNAKFTIYSIHETRQEPSWLVLDVSAINFSSYIEGKLHKQTGLLIKSSYAASLYLSLSIAGASPHLFFQGG